ncbi:MAG: efflux transporter outer membrane subunit [Alphaproteobacteria bacterium]|nr:efflux transporter outer membrane subunit [Alphaproteobacteria bacterium]MDE2041868.1 efflux transporter outer membrane subunit [Alphaproteobacteria bacterium]MDE2340721.1 efflux transporter outer membrane subunit [Alphaproteobacteria bacterium]
MSRARTVMVCLGPFALAACAVGPDFKTPSAPPQTRYTPHPITATAAPASAVGGGAQTLVPGADLDAQWWTLFHSHELNALIEEALKANTDLAAARAALKQAQETYKAQRGVLFPQVDASASTSRAKGTQYLAPALADNSFDYNLQTAQVNVGYTLDLFGGNRRAIEAAKAQFAQQRFLTEATRITLAANVAAAAFQEASLRAQVAAQGRIIKLEEDTLGIMHRQQAQGQIAGADVLAQDAALAQARAALPPLQKALTVQQDLLAYLTGHAPGDGDIRGVNLATLTLPGQLPISLPSVLVRQRPDVRAAEENLHSASAQLGVATAARLPNIMLSASAGGTGSSWRNLLSPANSLWSLGAGVTAPLFDGGSLLHKQRAARAALEQAGAQYRSAVLTAFQNVADTLHALQLDADALGAAQAAQTTADRSFQVVQYQYKQGAVPFVNVLAAEQALRQADQALVQAQVARFADTAALYQALGGGWWNAPEAAQAK